ncbi:uncharacterized protein N7458_004302 [Penicillium daleae]|uniref:ABC transporter domain-containing protein n=1 Tax=Penicillium daleae TaxID=63821 RepID=A0AAD6G5Q0_9EURO|nr:uncharacterized protein N7458_004302 [Penicillium daleae]KAJ5456038.1 hypothetical protein N7458_004302 [Penicillium daleae]
MFSLNSTHSGRATIIDNSSRYIKPGEILLVLGNPGAGYTTLLSVLSNHRNSFAEITGDVSFGSITSQEAKQYRGQIIMNTEEEIFFPDLSVSDTIDFATRLKVPFHLPPDIKNKEEYAQIYKEFLLKSLGITHTKDTKVGDKFIRSVSGSERKRVSILEYLATRGSFDKILILDSGKQIFYGPRDKAVLYIEDLGFLYDPAANKSDFLTSNTGDFKEQEAQDKHKNLLKKATESAGYFYQGDKKTLFIKQATTIVQALIGGSLFYNTPDNTAGLFIKGGSLFFSLLYPTFIALAEVTDSFVGRPVLAKHRDFALHYLSTFVFAQVITNIPIMLFQISHFGILINLISALAITQLFKFISTAFPNFDAATKASGFTIVAAFTYTGYIISKPDIYPWFINPIAYAFEALLANEFHNQVIPCVGLFLVPNSEGYSPETGGGQAYTGVRGAPPGATSKNPTYTVKTPYSDRVLLDNVQGFVKPGTLGALIGSLGAGKTTLLDVLAQRKTNGAIHSSVLVNSRPLPVSFQRSAGYVEQIDIHESLSTVREALEFSTLLRQNREIPREEKLRYVDTIVKLLQLEDLEHTLIGRPSTGLSVEQRKRLTISVELVAKPSILIFLDEPTSSLDSQAANNTLSADLFAQFDTLLLLAKGGKTVYFGDIGHYTRTVKKYFANHSAPCPQEANPAKHMIKVVSGSLSKELDTLVADTAAEPPGTEQVKLVTHRINISLFRNTEYINNKLILHILLSLYNGFSFYFLFIAPSLISQLQPILIDRRNVYKTREKKRSTFFVAIFYEMLYTGIRQSIAAYAPNATFTSLVNPLVITTLVLFYGSTTSILLTTSSAPSLPSPPSPSISLVNGQGIGRGTNLLNPGATENCEVCRYTTGQDYLKTLNLNEEYYGWRNAGLVVLWAGVFYALVFLMMKLRTKATKRAST